MRRLALALSLSCSTMSLDAQPTSPPVAPVHTRIDTLHGQPWRDDYFWLREKSNPEVIKYLEAENAWTEAKTGHLKPLQEQLFREISGRIKQTDLSVPYRDRGWWYYTRTVEGQNYPIFARKPGSLDAAEQVMLDQNELAKGKPFHSLGGWEVSPDGNVVAFLEDTTALRVFTLRFKDLRTGQMLADVVRDVGEGGIAWADDNRTVFYTKSDSARRPNSVWRHALGGGTDPQVYRDDDVLYNVNVSRTKSGAFIVLGSGSFTSAEYYTIPAARPTESPRVVAPRRPNVEYSVDHIRGQFLITTNADGATNFKVVTAPEGDPAPRNWRDWQPHDEAVFVEGILVFATHVAVAERFGGLRRMRIVELATKQQHFVTFPEVAYGVFPASNPEYETSTLRFTYSSLVTPPTVYDYDMNARTRELKKETEVLGGYDRSRYEVRRLSVKARDGAMVPVSLLVRKGFTPNGASPALLYAYGSYGATTEPTFRSNVFSLVDRGVVYAIAHIRGGQEMGRRWYDDGKMLKKKNTFFDFIDVGQYLVDNGYARRDALVANGGSAGGLLMGAVANLAPQLFRAIVADVPFVDVINTMRDASLPLTAQEWEQWGNPSIKAEFDYMRSYSPYDNIERKAYPWILATTSLNDSQVMYHEPAKWVARLRTMKTDSNPLLLKTNMAGGHGGSSGRYDQWREQAFRFAFMLDAMGLARTPTP
ncbi:MAG: S9 family peptidase [Gemmatimonadaceae bacterium]|jgi:oligopeptidase B|nr:S9 family peptidase [Gemmatimonadaceae bacterium]